MQPFIIPVKGLKDGRSHYDWHADGQFFGEYENTEVVDADLQIAVDVNNFGDSVEIECKIDGTVTVICDRCLENVTLPVHTSFEEENELDLNQDIYDYTCISLPMQRVHPDGECNPETVKFLNK